nr:MAG TPA: hypothetical protein [Caudoviricetes sp.]
MIQISPVETQGDASYFIVFFRETQKNGRKENVT